MHVNYTYISRKISGEMLKDKKRKEVMLESETLNLLQLQAEKQGRNLKNYMEHILREKANEFELTDAYKSMMDEILDKHEKGASVYLSKEEFLQRIVNK